MKNYQKFCFGCLLLLAVCVTIAKSEVPQRHPVTDGQYFHTTSDHITISLTAAPTYTMTSESLHNEYTLGYISPMLHSYNHYSAKQMARYYAYNSNDAKPDNTNYQLVRKQWINLSVMQPAY